MRHDDTFIKHIYIQFVVRYFCAQHISEGLSLKIQQKLEAKFQKLGVRRSHNKDTKGYKTVQKGVKQYKRVQNGTKTYKKVQKGTKKVTLPICQSLTHQMLNSVKVKLTQDIQTVLQDPFRIHQLNHQFTPISALFPCMHKIY